jgi:hypothetical protein
MTNEELKQISVTSSYYLDWLMKEINQDQQFLLADLAKEQEEAMRETDPEDWSGVENA